MKAHMSIRRSRISMIVSTLLAVVCITSLAACRPAMPSPQVENELVPFMLDLIISRAAGDSAPYTRSAGQQWADAPLDASIVVWAPPVDSPDQDGIQYLKTDQPNKVWWYADHQLAEVTDGAQAIQQFRQVHFSGNSVGNKGWGYYEFGILSVSNAGREARVYVGISCGPLCGTGTIYTLERTDAGAWRVKDSEMKWIS